MKCLPKNKQEVTEEDKSLAKLCRALGHDARVHIVKMLLHDDLCICNDFVDTLPLSQSTVSQHIKAPKGKKNKEWKNTRDKEASFTKKNWRTYHWFKWHIETSEKWDFIMNTTYTTAKVHDSQAIDALMTWDEQWDAYWDSAYWSKKRNEFLEANWINPEFNEKWVRWTPLSPYQKEQNRIKSWTRAKVEHPFATLKTRYWNYKVKYRWLVNNAMHWFLSCAIYNFEILARRYT